MATSAIFNHAMTAAQSAAMNMVTPLDSGTSSTTGTTGTSGSSGSGDSGDSATISANDFLTLLVTEMQNQDPTADTDPNEYINQLVQVNSLEQLIDINQTLTTSLGGSSSTGETPESSSSPTTAAGAAVSELEGGSSMASSSDASPSIGQKVEWFPPTLKYAGAPQQPGNGVGVPASPGTPTPESGGTPRLEAAGNFTIPKASPAAARVAHALDGRTHAAQINPAPISAAN
jgi:hypothetical protein